MRTILAFLILGFMIASPQAFAQKYKIAKGYSVKFDGGGDVAGSFKELSGTIVFNETDLTKSSVSLTIKTGSVNTGNGMMNNHAKGKEWFDAKGFPTITFTSKSFAKTAKGYDVTGTLEMKGVKKEITIAFTFTKTEKGGEFKAKFQVDRTDYGVGKKEGTVGAAIKLDFVIPVTKA
ncbi:MAG: YceI family protein [Flavobacteriales bacterium]